MKKLIICLLALTAFAALKAQQYSGSEILREHRAIWMSPMLGSTWPGQAITEANKDSRLRDLDKKMERLRTQGINVIYYHARAFCDATYDSSYEPYASSVAGSRGGTPAIDPFAAVVASAHAHGIEVYAWINPLRYSNGGHYSGTNPLNYENSHPEWLLASTDQIILNPAIAEVRQRVADICGEIATNYDIDGMIMDDYFYHSSIKMDADASFYNAQTAGMENKPTQGQWRRNNINMVVDMCRQAVKNARPYAVFAMGPAGKISPPDIASYGLTPGPCGDMNYGNETSGLYADPIKWLANGWLDFLSPQVYWIENFNELTDWYSVAVPHFGRHLFTSVDCSRLGSGKAAEYLRQIEYMRSHLRANESGVVFFDYGAYVNYYERFDAKSTTWGDILAQTVFPCTALTPIRPWDENWQPAKVSHLRREGTKLVWDEPEGIENHRYVVYAIEDGSTPAKFNHAPSALKQVVYTNEYDISANPDANYGVAVYTRRGNEYQIIFEDGVYFIPTSPANNLSTGGDNPADLFDFSWQSPAVKNVVEVSETRDFSSVLARTYVIGNTVPSSQVADFQAGKQYFWRVIELHPNADPLVSSVATFTPERIAITSPNVGQSDLGTTHTFTWTAAAEGTEYTLEIAENTNFSPLVYSAVETGVQHTVAPRNLVTGRQYYARVTGRRAGAVSTSATVNFATENRTDHPVPSFVNPASDGAIVSADQGIEVAQWENLVNVTVEISATTSFPVRSVYKATLSNFETSTRPLSEVKISSKNLTDGATYYTRTRGSYALTTSTGLSNTEYSPVRSFVYSALSGVENVAADRNTFIDEGNILHSPAGEVAVYDLAGRTLLLAHSEGATSLAHLSAGCYIIRVDGLSIKWSKN